MSNDQQVGRAHEPPAGVKCTHCNGKGYNEPIYDEQDGWIDETPCETCNGSGRITTVEQYLTTLPANWHEDSGLATWFPLVAEEIELLRQQRDELLTALQQAEHAARIHAETIKEMQRAHAERFEIVGLTKAEADRCMEVLCGGPVPWDRGYCFASSELFARPVASEEQPLVRRSFVLFTNGKQPPIDRLLVMMTVLGEMDDNERHAALAYAADYYGYGIRVK